MPETILVTGASGYIAKHIVVKLLNAGYHVRGSVRSVARGAEVTQAVTPMLDDASELDARLTFVALDLSSDTGWDAALDGVDALMHTASPFPLEQPKNEDDTIRPAVDGTLRALNAAKTAGITRVVMTSSTVSIMMVKPGDPKTQFDETDWSVLEGPTATPYAKSKTLAERAAWDFVANEAPEMQLTAINPSFVMGAPLDENFGTSIQVVERLMKGKDPMLPAVGFPSVDVQDIAEMHVRALQRPETAGERIAGVGKFLWLKDMADALKTEYPNRKIATRVAPNIMIRMLALFDKALQSIAPILGRKDIVSNEKAKTMLDMEFRDPTESVVDAGRFLVDRNLV
jgi:dihydroflavonol-4-reductase